jgi:hypothetical protein
VYHQINKGENKHICSQQLEKYRSLGSRTAGSQYHHEVEPVMLQTLAGRLDKVAEMPCVLPAFYTITNEKPVSSQHLPPQANSARAGQHWSQSAECHHC